MSFLIRGLLYAVCLFLVMIVYTGQKHETASDTLQAATKSTVKFLIYSAVGIAVMFGLQMLLID